MALGDPTKTWGTGAGSKIGGGGGPIPTGPALSTIKPAFGSGGQSWNNNVNTAQGPTGLANGIGGPNPYDSIIGVGNAYYAPEFQQYEWDKANLTGMAGMKGAWLDQQGQFLRDNSQFDQRGNAADMRGNAIQQANLRAIMAMYPGYFQNANDVYQNQRKTLAGQGNMERIGINSDATGRGAFLSPMRGVKQFDSLFRQARGEADATNSYAKNYMDLTKAQGNTQTDLDMLGVMAEKFGIDKDKIGSTLAQGLASLGYDKFVNQADLLAAINGTDTKKAQLARDILTKAAEMGKGLGSGGVGSMYGMFG